MGVKTTQKRLGALLTIFSAFIVCAHAAQRIISGQPFFEFPSDVFYGIFVAAFWKTCGKESLANKTLQVFGLIATGIFTLYFGTQDFIGISILATAIALCYVYGFFQEDTLLKIVLFEAGYALILLIVFSPELTTKTAFDHFIRVAMFLAFINTFCLIYYFILTDMINKIKKIEEEEKIELIKASLVLVHDRKKRDGRYGPFTPDAKRTPPVS